MNHRVRAAGEHHVGIAAADDLDRLADRLAAGGAGRQAVEIRSLGVEEAGQVAGRHVRLLLQFGDRMQCLQTLANKLREVELIAAAKAGNHHFGETIEILLAFAAAGIDAEASRIKFFEVQARVCHGLLGGANGKMGMPALIFPIRRVFAYVREVPVAHFGGDLGGKVAGVEQRGVADARLAGHKPPPHRFDVGSQGRNTAHPGDYNASSHSSLSFISKGKKCYSIKTVRAR